MILQRFSYFFALKVFEHLFVLIEKILVKEPLRDYIFIVKGRLLYLKHDSLAYWCSKEDSKMVKSIDRERVLGRIKYEKSITDFFTGAGTGLVASCLFSPDSIIRTVVIIIGLVMISIGWYKKAKCDKKVFKYMEDHED